jgi:polar amino acid transport system substrate-binding protein
MKTNTRRTTWRLFAVFAVLALVVAACGDGDGAGDGDLLAQLQESGSITLGIANEIPYGFEDEATGEVTGAAPEVAKVVLAELGITDVDAVVVEFGALIGGLQAGNFDMVAAGMYITPDRAEQIIFSDPDYCILEGMLVPAGNPDGLTDYNSVAGTGLRMAVAAGTVNVDYAVWAGLDPDQIVEFAGIEDQYDAIQAGRVDVVSGTIETVSEHANALDGFEAVGPFPALDEDGNEVLGCGGFGFLDQGLRDAFNDVLNQLKDDRTTVAIIDEFLTPGFAEGALGITREDVLGQ